MKKWVTIILSVAMVLSSLTVTALTNDALGGDSIELPIISVKKTKKDAETVDNGTCGDNITWTLDSNGLLEFSGTGDMTDYYMYDEMYLEFFEEEYTFTQFLNNSSIIEVVIDEGITSIGDYVFQNCSKLTSVKIPSTVTDVGYDSFVGCSELSIITIDEDNANYDSRDNCNAIINKTSNELFLGCKNTTIPNSVTSIKFEAFKDCVGLTSVEIPSGITKIWDGTFSGCSNLTNVIIPDTVKYINNYAFSGCSSLTSVKIPNSVTYLGADAFGSCTALESVEIPSSVTHIDENPFFDCDNLGTIVVDSNNTVYDSRNNCNAIIEKSSNKLVSGCKNTTIPYGIKSIGTKAFGYLDNLTNISIPSSVTKIGWGAFMFCTNLANLEIPNSVTSIDIRAFEYCSSLTKIEIPNSVTSIGTLSFSYCANLKHIEIPSSLTSIGYDAFYKVSAVVYCDSQEYIDKYSDDYGGYLTWAIKGSNIMIGDFNNDQMVNTSDAVYLLMHTQFPEDSTYKVNQNIDFNKDGRTNSKDAIYLLMHTQFSDDYPL